MLVQIMEDKGALGVIFYANPDDFAAGDTKWYEKGFLARDDVPPEMHAAGVLAHAAVIIAAYHGQEPNRESNDPYFVIRDCTGPRIYGDEVHSDSIHIQCSRLGPHPSGRHT